MGILKDKYKENQHGQIIIRELATPKFIIDWVEAIYNKFGFDQIYVYDMCGTMCDAADYEIWAYEMPKISSIEGLEEYIEEFNLFQYMGKEFELCVTTHNSKSFSYKPKEEADALILKM